MKALHFVFIFPFKELYILISADFTSHSGEIVKVYYSVETEIKRDQSQPIFMYCSYWFLKRYQTNVCQI